MKHKHTAGFTVVELVVATAIVSMVLVTVTSGVTFSIKNSRYSQEKALSVRYAQESVEWVRSQRDILGWSAFVEEVGPATQATVLCLDTIDSQAQLGAVIEAKRLDIQPDSQTPTQDPLNDNPDGGSQYPPGQSPTYSQGEDRPNPTPTPTPHSTSLEQECQMAADTRFDRTLTLVPDFANDRLEIQAQVSWKSSNSQEEQQTTQLTTALHKWR